jgi:hypothetical protein
MQCRDFTNAGCGTGHHDSLAQQRTVL